MSIAHTGPLNIGAIAVSQRHKAAATGNLQRDRQPLQRIATIECPTVQAATAWPIDTPDDVWAS